MKPSPKLIGILSRLLIVVAIIGTLFAAFIVVENLRGDRAWNQVEMALKARGEPIEFDSLQRTPIPDELNFFKDPRVAILVAHRSDSHEMEELERKNRLIFFEEGNANLRSRQGFVDLRKRLRGEHVITGPDSANPAVDILEAMETCRPMLDGVRESARVRPLAGLEMGNLPFEVPAIDMGKTFGLGVALGVRASAEIESGRTGDAYTDIVALQRISDGLSQHPYTLISALVGGALEGSIFVAIDNGCKRSAWNEAQLAEFQARMDRMRPLAAIKEALQFERAAVLFFVGQAKAIPTQPIKRPVWMFHGWLEQNKANFCVRFDEVLEAIDTGSGRVYVERLPAKENGGSPTFNSPYGWVWRSYLANIGPLIGGFATDLERQRLYSLSLAFQRYRLAHGHYPDKIADLVPDYIEKPTISILNGQAYRYLNNPAGPSKVYSFGNDGHDDKGSNDDIVVDLPGSL